MRSMLAMLAMLVVLLLFRSVDLFLNMQFDIDGRPSAYRLLYSVLYTRVVIYYCIISKPLPRQMQILHFYFVPCIVPAQCHITT